MANKIIMKKSSVAAKIPLATDLEVGEIAGNLEDQKLYSKKPDGTVVLMGSGLGGSGDVEGPSSATNGAVALFDGTTGRQLKNGQVPGSIYTQNANNVNIDGGAIDGTAIGNTTRSTGDFTNLSYTGGLNGTTGSAGQLAILQGAGLPIGVATGEVGGDNTFELTTADAAGDQSTKILLRGGNDSADIEFYKGARGSETQNMILKGDGNLGIGTSDPDELLHIRQTDTNNVATFARFSNTTNALTGFDVGVVNNTGDAILYNRENTAMRLATNNSERFRLTASGNLGIGTSNPTEKLHVNGKIRIGVQATATTHAVRADRNIATGSGLNGGGNLTANRTFSVDSSVVRTSRNIATGSGLTGGGNLTTNRTFSVDSSVVRTSRNIATGSGLNGGGNLTTNRTFSVDSSVVRTFGTQNINQSKRFLDELLVGTTTNSKTNTGDGLILGSAGTLVQRRAAGTNRVHIEFVNGGNKVGQIKSSSTTTSYITSSDYRLKENLVPIPDALTRVSAIPVYRFNFIADPDKTVDGFVAHKLASHVPEAVTGEKDEVDEDGNPVHQGVDQSKVVPLLTAAVQELLEEVNTLKARVAQLEGN